MRAYLIVLLMLPHYVMADDHSGRTRPKEGAGLVLGAIVGGLLGGPPGAILGAAGGTWFGHRDDAREQELAELAAQLNASTLALARLQTDFADSQRNLLVAGRIDEQASEPTLVDGLAFNVYFRTADATVSADLVPHLQHLSQFLSATPALRVALAGHADQRGQEPDNAALSARRVSAVLAILTASGLARDRVETLHHGEARAQAAGGDLDGYALDRKVTIRLHLDEQPMAAQP